MAKKRETTTTSTRTKHGETTLTKARVPHFIFSDEEMYEQVARKAYELYQQRGEEPGHDLEDWLTAERLVKAELLHGPLSDEPVEEE